MENWNNSNFLYNQNLPLLKTKELLNTKIATFLTINLTTNNSQDLEILIGEI
jgi:hypothetical protein